MNWYCVVHRKWVTGKCKHATCYGYNDGVELIEE
jgi:hypothetical protein